VHGKLLVRRFNRLKTKYFLPLYHPAAALYNGDMREVLIQDFKKIPKILEKIEKQELEEKEAKIEQKKLF